MEAMMPYLVIPDGKPGAGYTLYEALGKPITEGKLDGGDGLLKLSALAKEKTDG
jgi:hypothetical protein